MVRVSGGVAVWGDSGVLLAAALIPYRHVFDQVNPGAPGTGVDLNMKTIMHSKYICKNNTHATSESLVVTSSSL